MYDFGEIIAKTILTFVIIAVIIGIIIGGTIVYFIK